MIKFEKAFKGTKALAMSALTAALVLIMVIISTYLLDIGLLIMFFLPLFSTIITLTCEKKYVFVYFIATLLMSLINFQIAIFEIIPSLIIGILSGILINHKTHGYLIIFLNALILTMLQVLSTFLIDLIYEVNMVTIFSTLLHIKLDTMTLIYPLFLFIISLIQSSISYLISLNELKKFNYNSNEKLDSFYLVIILNIVMIIFTVISYFYVKSLSFLFVGASIYFMITLSNYIYSYKERRLMLILQTILFAISIISIYVILSLINFNHITLVLLLLPISSLISSSIIIIIEKLIKKNQITESSFEKLS